MKKRILLSGGGTLGSVTPLIAVVEETRRQNKPYDFFWVGTTNGPEREFIKTYDLPFYTISSGKWRRYFDWRNLLTPFSVIMGFIDANKLLQSINPQILLTAGGFVSVPLALAAWWRNIPIAIHEQDLTRGLANKLMRPFATYRTGVWNVSGVTIRGNFVRPSIFGGQGARVRERFALPDLPIVLVIGGGTGALKLNQLAAEMIKQVRRRAIIINLTGVGRGGGKAEMPYYIPLDFVNQNLADFYAAADLVICRAGMATLSELAALSKTAIVVPIPNSHQENNAKALAKAGAAVVLEETKLSGEKLAKVVGELLEDQVKCRTLGSNLHNIIPNIVSEFVSKLDEMIS